MPLKAHLRDSGHSINKDHVLCLTGDLWHLWQKKLTWLHSTEDHGRSIKAWRKLFHAIYGNSVSVGTRFTNEDVSPNKSFVFEWQGIRILQEWMKHDQCFFKTWKGKLENVDLSQRMASSRHSDFCLHFVRIKSVNSRILAKIFVKMYSKRVKAMITAHSITAENIKWNSWQCWRRKVN